MERISSQAQRRSIVTRLIEAIDPKTLSLDLRAGWIAWVSIIIAGGVLSLKSPVSHYAFWDYLDHHWERAFFCSFPVVLVSSLIHLVRQRRPWHVAFTTCSLYAGPIAISYIGLTFLNELYRGYAAVHTTHLQHEMGLIAVIFYLAGIGYLAVKTHLKDDQAIAAFLVPPYTIAILAVSLAFFKIITAPDYLYRNAFQLTVQTAETKDGQVRISGTFHVKKPATYVFTAIGNTPFYLSDGDRESPALTWKTATPSAEGDYAFDLTCKEGIPAGAPDATPPANTAPYGNDEPLVYFQISVIQGKGGKAPLFVRSIPINTWEIIAYTPAPK